MGAGGGNSCIFATSVGSDLCISGQPPDFRHDLGNNFCTQQYFPDHPGLYYQSSNGVAIHCLVSSFSPEPKIRDFRPLQNLCARSTPPSPSVRPHNITRTILSRANARKIDAAIVRRLFGDQFWWQIRDFRSFQEFRLRSADMAWLVRLHYIVRETKKKLCLTIGNRLA